MYKVGDEVLIKGEVIEVMNDVPFPIKVRLGSDNGGLVFTNDEVCYADKIVKTYEQGLADAWQLAKKIVMDVEDGGFDSQEVIDVFGKNRYYSFKDLTAEEALAKIEAYEEEKEIKVGDEVVHGEGTTQIRFFATLLEKNRIEGYDENGYTHAFAFPNPYIKKTGKHIGIEGLLKQIGE